MKNAFKKSDTLRLKRPHHQYNLIVLRTNYYEFSTTILTSIGPKIWNSFPVNIKFAETFVVFKKLIKTRDGEMYKCCMCTCNKNH